MSCPAENVPIKARLEQALDGEEIELPVSYYLLTLGMVSTVAVIPFLYRRLWLVLFDFIEEIRQARNGPMPPPGCRKLGKTASQRSMKDLNRSIRKENGSTKDIPKMMGKVIALVQYPVKSCCGIEVDEAEVLHTGFRYDELFCFAQFTTSQPEPLTGKVSSRWNVVTQRTHPVLESVKTVIWVPDSTSKSYDKMNEYTRSSGCIQLSFPFTPSLSLDVDGLKALWTILIAKLAHLSVSAEPRVFIRIPLHPDAERIKAKAYSQEDIDIGKDTYPQALNLQSEIDPDHLAKLKYSLGVSNPFTLFRVNSEKSRPRFNSTTSGAQLDLHKNLGSKEYYPLSMLNLVRVRDMKSNQTKDRSSDDFSRLQECNIYVSGPPNHSEDPWTLLSVGGKVFHVAGGSARSDNDTTLNPYLGISVIPSDDALGRYLKRGDSVEVLKTEKPSQLCTTAKSVSCNRQ